MSDAFEDVVSVFLDSPRWWDRTFRKVGTDEPVYVVEYKHWQNIEYGGHKQKRHQRRYRELRHAVRRLNFLIATTPNILKAFILSLPVDVKEIRKTTQQEDAVCIDCGSSRWRFNQKAASKRKDCIV